MSSSLLKSRKLFCEKILLLYLNISSRFWTRMRCGSRLRLFRLPHASFLVVLITNRPFLSITFVIFCTPRNLSVQPGMRLLFILAMSSWLDASFIRFGLWTNLTFFLPKVAKAMKQFIWFLIMTSCYRLKGLFLPRMFFVFFFPSRPNFWNKRLPFSWPWL